MYREDLCIYAVYMCTQGLCQMSSSITLNFICGARVFQFYSELMGLACLASQFYLMNLPSPPLSEGWNFRWAAMPAQHLCGCWESERQSL